jgi:hypothetical protein
MTDFSWRQQRAALLIAHPGHELRVFHWLEIARPLVCVLTDGSGRTNQSRLSSTTQILDKTCSKAGPVYGRFTDAEIYAAILKGNVEVFVEVMRQLARSFTEQSIQYVVHDAIEGYNPSHDLCWHLAGATSLLASKANGRTIRMFDFPLTGRPDDCPAEIRDTSIRVALDNEALRRKLAAAEAYPELKTEVDAAREKFGDAPFTIECLRPAADAAPHLEDTGEVPFYESHGESRTRSGYYVDVIRRRKHMLPLARRLWQTAAQTESCASS